MNRELVFNILKETKMVNTFSEEYKEGFNDCYWQLVEKFEEYFQNLEKQYE